MVNSELSSPDKVLHNTSIFILIRTESSDAVSVSFAVSRNDSGCCTPKFRPPESTRIDREDGSADFPTLFRELIPKATQNPNYSLAMEFNVKGWGWVGDIYHKVESMIQEVDDLMKEKTDPTGESVPDAGENKNKFSFLEVQAALQQVEEVHYPMTDEKKPDPCFNNSNDAIADKSCQLGDENGEHALLNAEQSPLTRSLVGYIGQDAYEPPDVDILVECDEGNVEASKCKSILNSGAEDWIIKRNSEITQPFKNDLDQKASETESAIEAANSDSTHSSMSLVFTSEIGDIDKLGASGMTRNLPDDKLKDSGSSTPFLINSPKELSFEHPTIHFKSGLSDNHVDTRNVEEAVLESSQCEDELASVIEKDLCEMLLTLIVVDDMSPSQHKTVANSLPAATNALRSNELVPFMELLEKDETRSYESDTSSAFWIDSNMETIDLEEKGMLRESGTSVDVRGLFAVPERVKRFRSIKRKIMDAFASRQRIAKEYEQLGILHGDINFEHGGHPMIHTASALDNRSSIEHPYDYDWELL